MSHLVSVVVPAYNRSNRIESSLLSIAAQDYENIELIVVDDGSSDGTGNVAESVLMRLGRDFKLIRHETNMGVSVARNSGLRCASGDYVIFFDSDDIADPDFVSTLLEAITKDDGDVAFCGYRQRFEHSREERAIPVGLDPRRQYSTEEITIMLIHGQLALIIAAMFKTNFLKTIGLEFTPNCIGDEDGEFLTKAFSRCKKIGFSTKCSYVYIMHNNNTTKILRSTRDEKICYYADRAATLCRKARYLTEHAESQKVRDIGNYILSEGLVKTLNAAAMHLDKAKFYQTLNMPETRQALFAGCRYFFKKPELFIKAVFLLIAPSVYFWVRSKS